MNDAKALLAANDLKSAIQAATSAVKAKPTDTSARTFLFELLIFAGEFDRAEKQLDALGQQDASALIGTQIYRQCIAAEKKRQKVFSADAVPEFITAKPAYVQMLLDAILALRNNDYAAAREKLDKSETERPAIAGKLNGATDFQDLRDYNDLTTSIFEVFVKGEYVWLPIEFVKQIKIAPRANLRDIYWTQATIEALDGTNGEVLLPGLYVGSWQNSDDQVRLGRATDWSEIGAGDVYQGVGTRLFWMDGIDQPFTNVETIEFQAQ